MKQEIEIIKQMVANGDLPQEVAEKYFPELKESEDEKVRKKIFEFLNKASGGFLDATIPCKTFDKWAVWVEKQGEQKPISAKKFQEAFERMAKQYEIELPMRPWDIHALCWDLYTLLTKPKSIKKSEPNTEQKPAEWSEEDEKKLETILYYIRVSDYNGKRLSYSEFELADWLKFLKERYTWKPSDEQMDALDSTLQYGQVSHNSFEHLNSLFNDLKKLR